MTTRLIANVLLLFVILFGGGFAGADDLNAWPQVNGPFGNFNPRRYDVRLVDDLNQAYLADERVAAVLRGGNIDPDAPRPRSD